MKAHALSLKGELRLSFGMLRIQASGTFPSVVVVFEKTTDGTRRERPGSIPDVERWIFERTGAVNYRP
jgi:hypothetical protein